MDKTEAKIQQEIVTWFNNTYCLKHMDPREIIFHVANEGQQRLAKIGVLGCVADLLFTWHGVMYFCEVKTPEGTQSPVQKDFEARVIKMGFSYFLVRSCCEFQKYVLSLPNVKQCNA